MNKAEEYLTDGLDVIYDEAAIHGAQPTTLRAIGSTPDELAAILRAAGFEDKNV